MYLKDKGLAENNGALDSRMTDKPQLYLSPAAIERRQRRGISIDKSDLPIARSYLDTLSLQGGRVVTSSKWFSTVVVESADTLAGERLAKLSFVDSVKWIWKGEREMMPSRAQNGDTLKPAIEPLPNSIYGYAEEQIKMLDGVPLHERGYRGKGMRVAVIDAGFKDADRMVVFDSLDIAGTYNVVCPGESVFSEDEHGVKVLSCLAANLPGVMVGTAPEATYWLIKSEDNRSEYPVEEDYWIAAVEYADSVGADIISCSLGYYMFDEEELSYNPSMLDGRTALITRAADKAADKGMLLFISAGNEGNNTWEKITFPSDAENVLTVGGVTGMKERSVFSSWGFSADNRVKPDIVALGTNCAVVNGSGDISFSSGTSFSTPIAAGLGACLWQALPGLTNFEMIDLIRQTSSQFAKPDSQLGYGIPDFDKALKQKHDDNF